ncbi:MAG: right-handed parallel beta-helix repeat-containing protein [Anaerolineales bacterium]
MIVKKILPIMLALALCFPAANASALGATNDYYVSPNGDNANSCTFAAPCQTIQKGVDMLQAGDTLHIMEGVYSEAVTISKVGMQIAPIRIVGEGAVLQGGGVNAFSVINSEWVTFEGLTITDYAASDFRLRQSHYLTFRNNKLEFTYAAILVLDGVSHLLIENNEMYQTYPQGSTWSTLKKSKYEGAGVYASSQAQGMYYIRNNFFHDSMNGVYFADSGKGNWMNANVFISGNTFQNIVDDPFEPEGDSFNLHFFNNKLINTHRMVSIVPASTCVGPIFVYGNYQHDTIDPTGEAASRGRRNSAVKLNMKGGACPNGVWIFNNTVRANVAGINFFAVDHITNPNVEHMYLLNNVFVTEMNAYSLAPTITEGDFNFNISLKPFGYAEMSGIQSDPLLNDDGTLSDLSPAKGKAASIVINAYFSAPQIVPAGADLGAFKNFPEPVYVVPPDGEPESFPANVPGWPDAPLPPL